MRADSAPAVLSSFPPPSSICEQRCVATAALSGHLPDRFHQLCQSLTAKHAGPFRYLSLRDSDNRCTLRDPACPNQAIRMFGVDHGMVRVVGSNILLGSETHNSITIIVLFFLNGVISTCAFRVWRRILCPSLIPQHGKCMGFPRLPYVVYRYPQYVIIEPFPSA